MLSKLIKTIITIIFFFISIQLAFSYELIIPKKKPNIISLFIIPLKKPTVEQEQPKENIKELPKENIKELPKENIKELPKENIKELPKENIKELPKENIKELPKENIKELPKENIKKKITQNINNKINGILIPKKKPIIVKKQRLKLAKKTRYYSERDFTYAKMAIKFMEKANWRDAKKTAKKARAKSIYNFIEWRHLLTTGNKATFLDYKRFIERVENYPRLERIKYLAEHKISTLNQSPKEIINWFSNHKPLSGFGRMVLGESLIKTGKINEGINLIKKGFITADLSKNDIIYFRKKFKKYLKTTDFIKRADYFAWENKYWDLKRTIRYLPKDYQLLYTARQILMSKGYGVDSAISKVPEKFKNDPGLKYDRLKWRRKKGRLESSLEILLNIENTEKYMIRPDKWWVERSIIARSLIYKKKYKTAYHITSKHGLMEGPEFAEAEWMSGWIALSFLKDPLLAKNHFTKFYENVGYPISLSRGAYWLGRSYEKLNNIEESKKWYLKGSKFLTTYYGQLSHMKIKPKEKYELDKMMIVDNDYAELFYNKKLVAIVDLLDQLRKDKYTKHILRFLANDNIEKGSEILAAKLATDISRFDFAIQVSKIASYQKRFHTKYNYPIISAPTYVGGKKIPNPALILSIIRQESEFDTSAKSRVGAQGLMQLMPYTAKTVSKQAKISYSRSKLTRNPEYNINLGSFYIAGLLSNYGGSYPFATAAYNAGPKRVKFWKKINKNPQKNQIDYVDWIELIKFEETRNYVQRVLENYNVYRYILSQKPIFLKDFFKNDPLY